MRRPVFSRDKSVQVQHYTELMKNEPPVIITPQKCQMIDLGQKSRMLDYLEGLIVFVCFLILAAVVIKIGTYTM